MAPSFEQSIGGMQVNFIERNQREHHFNAPPTLPLFDAFPRPAPRSNNAIDPEICIEPFAFLAAGLEVGLGFAQTQAGQGEHGAEFFCIPKSELGHHALNRAQHANSGDKLSDLR